MVAVASRQLNVQDEDKAAAFDRLFLAEYSRVVSIAYRVLGDAHRAEDVAQDVFCSFYRQHPADASYAPAWLYRAAAHSALNAVRGDRRRRQREQHEAAEQERLRDGTQAALDPERALVKREQSREIQAALSRIPAKSAAVLVLRHSGLSYAEVGAALGIGANQVGTVLRRAEEMVRKEMSHATPQ